MVELFPGIVERIDTQLPNWWGRSSRPHSPVSAPCAAAGR